MISAYVVLGIPGNATAADIEDAYQRACATYSAQRVAEAPQVAEQLKAVTDAYNLLRDPQTRAAHDRKLARPALTQLRVDPAPAADPVSGMGKALVVLGVLATALIAGGYYMQHRREVAQAEIAARELEAARQQAIAEAENRKAMELEASERARREAANQEQERALRRDGDAALARAQSLQIRQDMLNALKRTEERREEFERRAEEQRRVNENQRRIALDRQRIRELCWINYRRYDC